MNPHRFTAACLVAVTLTVGASASANERSGASHTPVTDTARAGRPAALRRGLVGGALVAGALLVGRATRPGRLDRRASRWARGMVGSGGLAVYGLAAQHVVSMPGAGAASTLIGAGLAGGIATTIGLVNNRIKAHGLRNTVFGRLWARRLGKAQRSGAERARLFAKRAAVGAVAVGALGAGYVAVDNIRPHTQRIDAPVAVASPEASSGVTMPEGDFSYAGTHTNSSQKLVVYSFGDNGPLQTTQQAPKTIDGRMVKSARVELADGSSLSFPMVFEPMYASGLVRPTVTQLNVGHETIKSIVFSNKTVYVGDDVRYGFGGPAKQ